MEVILADIDSLVPTHDEAETGDCELEERAYSCAVSQPLEEIGVRHNGESS